MVLRGLSDRRASWRTPQSAQRLESLRPHTISIECDLIVLSPVDIVPSPIDGLIKSPNVGLEGTGRRVASAIS
jgi:hypothetical protein